MIDERKESEIKEALSFCNGSESLYKFSLSDNLYSEGVYKMTKLCNAEWLASDALIMCKKLSKTNSFITIEFEYVPNIKDVMACVMYTDGNDNVLDLSYLKFTDFPLSKFKMFYENNTLYLPSER